MYRSQKCYHSCISPSCWTVDFTIHDLATDSNNLKKKIKGMFRSDDRTVLEIDAKGEWSKLIKQNKYLTIEQNMGKLLTKKGVNQIRHNNSI